MARQDESIAKLQKDKKNTEENLKKTQEDLQAEEDKCNHLNKLKQKLEGNIDDVSLIFITVTCWPLSTGRQLGFLCFTQCCVKFV